MEQHWKYHNEAFEREFAKGSFPSEAFTHEAHLRLAFIHIKKYGKEIAVSNICSQLKQYTKRLGAVKKYHETLTIASVYIVYHFSEKVASEDFKILLKTFPKLKSNFKELLLRHYSEGIFQQTKAKHTYVVPDLQPFP